MKNSKSEDTTRVVCYTGHRVILRPIDVATDLKSCTRWINDPEVNQFIMAQGPITESAEREYLEGVGKDPYNIIFAIETLDTHRFIGTMGIHRINFVSRFATTGSLIGEKDCWGKGFGTDAKMLVLYHAFNALNLRKINSEVISYNERSAKCLIKCGYKEEGRRDQVHFRNGTYWDQIQFGIFREQFEPLWQKFSKGLEWYEKLNK